jgi:adenine-specific DNA methylase
LKPKGSAVRVWADPVTDKKAGTWRVRIVDNREQKARGKTPPPPTYGDGKGISLFSGNQIPDDWIKAKAQATPCEMRSALYAVAVKSNTLKFEPPTETDLKAVEAAERELAKHRKRWERENVIPTELYPEVTTDERPRTYGMPRWADLFSPRQLLGFGVLVEELRAMHDEIVKTEGKEQGEAIIHLLAFVIDKFANYNSVLSIWHALRGTMANTFSKHDFSFKTTFAEMAPCHAGTGFAWAIGNVVEAYEQIAKLPAADQRAGASFSAGSATSLPSIADKSMSAVVVDPPYADNVQYSELADFFYVWLKRTQGHRRPEWFSSYLCDHTEEAVVNVPRHRGPRHAGPPNGRDGMLPSVSAADARKKAHAFYQRLMGETFTECRRMLRDDGALTVMFTHKKQEAWAALFTSLVKAGFTITATWPVKTESEHSLHQAKKNAAQSTVILVARKRDPHADVGYFDDAMRREIRLAAQKTAERLMKDGLNPVDQLVGSFGPAMEVYSRHSEVRTDTGDEVGVDRALDEASEAVAAFRIQQLAARGLQEVEAEGRFYLLCWDVLQAAEFRFNEAHLLGKAVGMDMDTMVYAGLVSKSGDKIKILSAKDRRRAKKLEQEEMEETLFGAMPTGKKKPACRGGAGRRIKKGDVLKVHPNDQHFRTALDACHALALRYVEAGTGSPGLGNARQLAAQQGWRAGSPVARLMEALLKAAPPALWHLPAAKSAAQAGETGKKSAAALYPEFRAWHAIIEPLFGVTPPDWPEPKQDLELALQYQDETPAESEEDESDANGE